MTGKVLLKTPLVISEVLENSRANSSPSSPPPRYWIPVGGRGGAGTIEVGYTPVPGEGSSDVVGGGGRVDGEPGFTVGCWVVLIAVRILVVLRCGLGVFRILTVFLWVCLDLDVLASLQERPDVACDFPAIVKIVKEIVIHCVSVVSRSQSLPLFTYKECEAQFGSPPIEDAVTSHIGPPRLIEAFTHLLQLNTHSYST
ncbi:hypothetical protein E2C01_043994 [Portunus trituberculatus]|uniref:Uncharacterized protein n=1 Tax=Portunus trituberculatus TaxID=210409 RepID=A0A5B7FQW3_PORTR|nr:hypothetical protein [Portunus trituberculatus]